MNIAQTLKKIKDWKLFYYIKGYLRFCLPRFPFKWVRLCYLFMYKRRSDIAYIEDRVNYYNKLSALTPLPPNSKQLKDFIIKKHENSIVYFFEPYEFIRCYNKQLRWSFIFGDVVDIPEVPSIVKSRLISPNNANSIILKLNKIRHFVFVDDVIPYEEKQDKLIFRGEVRGLLNRRRFFEKHFGNPLCDLGDVYNRGEYSVPEAWKSKKITKAEHLKYKFILSLEGNDVATNLKWIMSSNSIAVMPPPQCETWFMEGRLKPDYHYIAIKPDYSDLTEKLQYYLAHTDEAKAIIEHAHEYVAQFKNKRREKIISFLVYDKYFKMTGQSNLL